MVIIDEQGHEIQDPDLSLGHLKEYRRLVAHHDAIEYQPPVYNEDVVKEYDNGGVLKERRLVTPAVEAQDAWDEYEDVLLYVLYTEEELADLVSSNDEPQEIAKQVEAIAEAAAQRDSQIAQMLNLVPKAAALSTAASRAISFTKKTWVDDPTSGTPITAADMNRLEQAIVDLNTTLTSVQNSVSQTIDVKQSQTWNDVVVTAKERSGIVTVTVERYGKSGSASVPNDQASDVGSIRAGHRPSRAYRQLIGVNGVVWLTMVVTTSGIVQLKTEYASAWTNWGTFSGSLSYPVG